MFDIVGNAWLTSWVLWFVFVVYVGITHGSEKENFNFATGAWGLSNLGWSVIMLIWWIWK